LEDQSIDDIGLLESVDRRIIFKIQEFWWIENKKSIM
jgi:hypothetical protein